MTSVRRPEQEAERLEALRAFEILDTLPEQVYDDITRIAAQICDVPIALVSLIDDDRQWFKSRVGLAVAETPRDQAFCAHAILAPGQVMIVEDARTDPRFVDNALVRENGGIRFYAGAPLITSDGHALGTLCVIDRKPRKLPPDKIENLRALARQVVAQLELRRMVRELERGREELARLCAELECETEATERDLHRAELIQRSLLPRTAPELPGCCVQSLYRPGRIVGGDLFDLVRIDDRHLAVVIADAAGHGFSAALLSMLFRQRLAFADSDGRPYPPGEVLARANAGLRAGATPPGLFVTAVVGLLDVEQRTFAMASAGHPPVLWCRAADGVRLLAQTGPALGLFDQASYAEHRLQLVERDRLLFYTDGLLDLNPSTPTAPGELAMVLDRVGRRPDAVQGLYDELSRAGIRDDRDDVTVLLLDFAQGPSCFLEPGPAADAAPGTAAPAGRMRFGETPDATFIVLDGRVTWLEADALHEAALPVIEGRRRLVIDLAGCESLDSTALGTLHELAVRADSGRVALQLRRVPERILAAFAELSLVSVQAHVSSAVEPLPEVLADIAVPAGDLRRHRQRLLRAHQALAGLSERNREMFAGVIGNLQAD